MASNMVAEWKMAKKEFEKVTGEKRPKASFLKIFTKDSGIEPALKKCDELANAKAGKGTADKLKEAMVKLQSKIDAYVDLLDKAIAQEAAKNDMYKSLKALKARTARFMSHYEVCIVEHRKSAEGDLLGLASAMAEPLVKKCVDNALAAIKRITAKPTVEVYDAEMANSKGEAGRKLATALQAVVNKGGTDKYDAAKYIKDLLPFSNPSGSHKMTMKGDSTKQDILANVKEFAVIVKKLNAEL